jgi:hypothetical protein
MPFAIPSFPHARRAGRRLLALLPLLAGWALGAAEGVLYFNRVPPFNAPAQLWRVNADGAGLQSIGLGVPAPLYPTTSPDGRWLLVTSKDPGRPFKISQNVFLHDLPSGAFGRITSFEDVLTTQGVNLTNDLGQTVGNRIGSGYTVHLPYGKAFSPDGTRVAVMTLRKTGSVTRDNIHSITNDPGEIGATSGRFPVVEVYRVADGQPLGGYVYLGVERTGFNQGGDGIDWHPARNEIVATLSSDIPATGNVGRTGMEGTILAVFDVTGPYQFLRKLTTPSGRADFFLDVGTLISLNYAEHDYAPAFSPSGQRVAYVRHTLRQDNRYDGAGIAPLPAQCAIRMVNYDGSGDHPVLQLADGLWVTRLTWSPDGTRIAFDLAPQTVINGWNMLGGDPARSEVYVMNADGTNPIRVAGAPAAYPDWAPGTGDFAPPRPVLGARRDRDKVEMRIENLMPGRRFDLEGTTDLTTWVTVGSFTASAVNEILTVTPPDGSPLAFYRVVVP